MNRQLESAIKLIALGLVIGFSLIGYADNKFATKSLVERLFDKIDIMDKRIYEIHKRGK